MGIMCLYAREDYTDEKVILIVEQYSTPLNMSLTNCIEDVLKKENLLYVTDWIIIQKNLYNEFDIVTVTNGHPSWKYLYYENVEKKNLTNKQVVELVRAKK